MMFLSSFYISLGITNFVTPVAAAYWAHSPVVCVTPEAGTLTKGLGGFQEADQLSFFSSITKYQGHVNNPKRMAEITARCFDISMNERGPTQLNIPRDFFYDEGILLTKCIHFRCISTLCCHHQE